MDREKFKGFMQSLRGKISLQMLAVGVIPVIIIGVATFIVMLQLTSKFDRGIEGSRKAMETEVVGHTLAASAEEVMEDIETELHWRMREALLWASAPIVVEAAAKGATMAKKMGLVGLGIDEVEKRMEKTRTLNASPAATRYIIDQMKKSGVFKEIFFTDAHGYNVALTGLTSDFVQKGEDWWDIAWEKGIHVGDVLYDESARVYSIAISPRIDDPVTGRPLGVMKAVLDIGAVQTVASEVASEIKDSVVQVFMSDGLLLADTSVGHDPKVIMNKEHNLLKKGYEPAKRALSATGDDPFGFIITQEEAVGYCHSAGSELYADITGFTGFNWGAVVKQKPETAFAPIGGLVAMRKTMHDAWTFSITLSIIVALIVAVAAVGLALYLARGIVRPVLHLSGAAESISRGDLDVEIAVDSRDEIGALAKSVDRMRASLKAAIERLQVRRTGT